MAFRLHGTQRGNDLQQVKDLEASDILNANLSLSTNKYLLFTQSKSVLG